MTLRCKQVCSCKKSRVAYHVAGGDGSEMRAHTPSLLLVA